MQNLWISKVVTTGFFFSFTCLFVFNALVSLKSQGIHSDSTAFLYRKAFRKSQGGGGHFQVRVCVIFFVLNLWTKFDQTFRGCNMGVGDGLVFLGGLPLSPRGNLGIFPMNIRVCLNITEHHIVRMAYIYI